jgi:hypothetical protein
MECHCFKGWICEEHPDEPWLHDAACDGDGVPCTDPDCPWWDGVDPPAHHALKPDPDVH